MSYGSTSAASTRRTRPAPTDEETDPLLSPDHAQSPEPSEPRGSKPYTPLPKLQLTIICLIRLVEPIWLLSLQPYINQMLLDVGAAKTPEEVGYPAAIANGVQSLVGLVTVFAWGVISDRIGRKPVLVFGALGTAFTAVLFGFSTNFTMIVIFRSLAAFLNGNITVLKCIMSEISDETNQARAFSFFPLALNAGNIIAAFIGGSLAQPAVDFPRLVERFPIFRTYPYLFVNIVVAIPPLIVGLIALVYLQETLPSKRAIPAVIVDPAPDSERRLAPPEKFDYSLLFSRQIQAIMLSFGFLSLLGSSIGALLPLFCFTPAAVGGLSFSAQQIGATMTIRSIATVVVQLVAFPWLQRHLGTLSLYRAAMWFWIPGFAVMPLVNLLARHHRLGGVWVGIVGSMVSMAIGNMSFVCNLLLVNANAPSRHYLGAINGISQAISSLVNIFGPGGASALYALQVKRHVLDGQAIWALCITFAGLAVVSAYWIRHRP